MSPLRAQGSAPQPILQTQVRALIESDAIIEKNSNGIVQQWSFGAETLFGYSAQEMIGRSILCLFPPERVNEEVALMQLIQEGQDLSYIETTRCHKDGTNMHVALNLTGVWDERGKLTSIRSAIRHIDQQVYNAQHMQDLLAQAQYLQRIVNDADAAIFSIDTRGMVHSWNPAAEQLFGWPSVEIIGHSVHALHGVQEQKDWHSIMQSMHAAKTVYTMETVRLHKDGRLIHVTASLTPIVNANHELIGVSATMRSIEDKIRARITELALQRQSKYFEAIVNSSDDAIVSTDLMGIVQSWNLSAERLFGYSTKEMVGQSILKVFEGNQNEASFLREQLLQGISVSRKALQGLRKDGTTVHLSISMSVLTDDTDAVVGIATIARDLSDRMVAEQTIWQHANFDMLTRLPNQRLLADRARQVLPECTRRQEKAALLYIDIDHLKEVNDELGHTVGDALLVEVARRLSSSIRVQDTVARLGGDDFVVLINGFVDTNTIDNVVQRIQKTLESPVQVASRNVQVQFSAGVSVYPDDANEWVELLGHADSALSAAKQAGRNRIRYFTQDLKEKSNRRRFILSAFQSALEQNELEMHYQPVVDMATGHMIKAEALIRWTHSTGPIAPIEFIPLIEQSDLIHKFGDFVVRQVTQESQALRAKFGPNFLVAFNVSPAQLKGSKSLVEHWRSLMGGAASFQDIGLIAEITESMMVDNDSSTQHNLLSLHHAGIGVAIDDFGTGYSSLNYLTKINAQVIKIDRSFTNELIVSSKTDALCEAIIAMAHKMGMRVVAEGVETKEQWDTLLKMGCDMAQGYYIAKPMPLRTLLSSWHQ